MRSAAAAARTRVTRLSRRDSRPRRPAEEVDEEREARGKPSSRERRRGLPSRGEARRAATHVDRDTGAACVLTADPRCFGFLGPDPPREGSRLLLEREGEPARGGRVAEVVAVAPGYYAVATR